MLEAFKRSWIRRGAFASADPIARAPSGVRRIGLRLVVVFLSAMVPIGGLELYLRAARPGSVGTMNAAAFTRVSLSPGQMTELIPGAENPHFLGGGVRVNEHGFRGPSFALAKPPGTTRVLAIGDSVTFGFGVPEERAFPSLLAASLSRGNGSRIEVINAGLPGAGLPYYFHASKRLCASVDPDLILVSLVLNDILVYPPEVMEDRPMPGARGPADPAGWGGTLRGSYAYTAGFQTLKSVLYAVHILDLDDSPGYRFVPLEEPTDELELAWASSLGILDQTLAAGAHCGVPVVIAVFPLEVQLSVAALAMYREGIGVPLAANATNLAPQSRLQEWAGSRNVPFVDLTPAFQVDDPGALYLRDAYVTLDPVHPSTLGHRRAALLLDTALRASNILAETPDHSTTTP